MEQTISKLHINLSLEDVVIRTLFLHFTLSLWHWYADYDDGGGDDDDDGGDDDDDNDDATARILLGLARS